MAAATTNSAKTALDITERAVLTYIEAFLGLLLAAGTTNIINLSTVQSAAVAALPAGLAIVKGAIGTLLGHSRTASWLPATADPANTPETATPVS